MYFVFLLKHLSCSVSRRSDDDDDSSGGNDLDTSHNKSAYHRNHSMANGNEPPLGSRPYSPVAKTLVRKLSIFYRSNIKIFIYEWVWFEVVVWRLIRWNWTILEATARDSGLDGIMVGTAIFNYMHLWNTTDLCNQTKLDTESIGVHVQSIQNFLIADREPNIKQPNCFNMLRIHIKKYFLLLIIIQCQ